MNVKETVILSELVESVNAFMSGCVINNKVPLLSTKCENLMWNLKQKTKEAEIFLEKEKFKGLPFFPMWVGT